MNGFVLLSLSMASIRLFCVDRVCGDLETLMRCTKSRDRDCHARTAPLEYPYAASELHSALVRGGGVFGGLVFFGGSGKYCVCVCVCVCV